MLLLTDDTLMQIKHESQRIMFSFLPETKKKNYTLLMQLKVNNCKLIKIYFCIFQTFKK